MSIFEQSRQLVDMFNEAGRVYWTVDGVVHVVWRNRVSGRSPFAVDTYCGLKADRATLSQLSQEPRAVTCLGCLADEGRFVTYERERGAYRVDEAEKLARIQKGWPV